MVRNPVAKKATRQHSHKGNGKQVSLKTLLVSAGKLMGGKYLVTLCKTSVAFPSSRAKKTLINWSCLSKTFCFLVQQTITQ